MKNTFFALSLGCSLMMIDFVEAKTSSTEAPVVKPKSIPSKMGTAKLSKVKTYPKLKADSMTTEHPFMQALIQAYTSNPELKAKVKEQNALAEELPKAYAGWRPSINGTAMAAYNKGTNQIEKITSSSHPKTAGLEVRQNVFEGGKTLANTTYAENLILAGNASFTAIEQSILLKAIQAYLDLWARRQELEINRTSVRFFEFSLEQAKARADVGEIGLTEIAEAEFSYSGALADFISAEAEVQNATATYIKVIGHQPPKELVLPSDIAERVTLPSSLEELKKLSTDGNPTLQQAVFDAKSAEAGIDIATADLMPKVDVVGDAGRQLNSRRRTRTHEIAARVEVKIPIYQGGSEWASIRASHQTAAQKAIGVRTVRRQVIENAIQVWETRYASKGRIKRLETQIKAGETRIEGTRQESLVGERTFLDVLYAQKDVVNARIGFVRATSDFLSSGYQILGAMGNLSAALLKLPVQKHNVNGYAEEVSGHYIGWGDVPSREEIRDAAGTD
ncbi:MAG: TolC family outer membrane protein [Candidatus Paracaedimonas acanthamoebae]|uniref:TolC family outer membrane protein n=1 Tax=Candidatus Paracaedimonas acanthamoebae TaxID=244581 RepID=A0A8J7PHY5_9PROT|nr:TolC family outer membrane protein [Candidatus Paracaedimonas acanthamoebae]